MIASDMSATGHAALLAERLDESLAAVDNPRAPEDGSVVDAEVRRRLIAPFGMMCLMLRLGLLRWGNGRRTLVFTMDAMLLVAGCSNGQSSSATKTGDPSTAAVEDSPAQACTRDVLAALALKWREDKAPLDQDDKKLLEAFMDANMVENTPQYQIFVDHYAAGTGPIALAIAQGRDHEEVITEQLGTESEGVAADCAR